MRDIDFVWYDPRSNELFLANEHAHYLILLLQSIGAPFECLGEL